MSRPVKRPPTLRKVWPEELIAHRILPLFRRHGAPASWGLREAAFLFDYAVKGPPRAPILRRLEKQFRRQAAKHKREPFYHLTTLYHRAAADAPTLRPAILETFDALMRQMGPEAFAPLFADVTTLWDKAFRSPEFTVAAELAIRADDPATWEKTTSELAAELTAYTKHWGDAIPVSEKVVEHARRSVRDILLVSP